jgi:hypothetical protein
LQSAANRNRWQIGGKIGFAIGGSGGWSPSIADKRQPKMGTSAKTALFSTRKKNREKKFSFLFIEQIVIMPQTRLVCDLVHFVTLSCDSKLPKKGKKLTSEFPSSFSDTSCGRRS